MRNAVREELQGMRLKDAAGGAPLILVTPMVKFFVKQVQPSRLHY